MKILIKGCEEQSVMSKDKLRFSEVKSMQTVVRTYPTPTRYNCDPDCYKILDKLLRDGWKVIMCNKIGNDLEYILEKD